jgi:hypothetical protein
MRTLPASLGSRSARSSSDPLRSANSTVTRLRSPSSALFDVRIFSARCLAYRHPARPGVPGSLLLPRTVHTEERTLRSRRSGCRNWSRPVPGEWLTPRRPEPVGNSRAGTADTAYGLRAKDGRTGCAEPNVATGSDQANALCPGLFPRHLVAQRDTPQKEVDKARHSSADRRSGGCGRARFLYDVRMFSSRSRSATGCRSGEERFTPSVQERRHHQ